jgi:hypothetical protein
MFGTLLDKLQSIFSKSLAIGSIRAARARLVGQSFHMMPRIARVRRLGVIPVIPFPWVNGGHWRSWEATHPKLKKCLKPA